MKRYTLLTLVSIMLTGCSFITGSQSNTSRGPDGGIFKSFDRGETFSQIVLIPSTLTTPVTIASADIITLARDPQDRLALYIGTRSQGMFYTYNGGVTWTKSSLAPQSSINAIAVDPKNKCTIYSAVSNQIFKSVDCSRSWAGTYVQDRPEQTITAIAVDPDSTSVVYAGDSSGNILKSEDFASSWTNVARFGDSIKEILIDTDVTNRVFVATKNRGLRRSDDSGDSWQDLQEGLKGYGGSNQHRKLILNPSKKSGLLYASQYGILSSEDSGDSWLSVPLLTAPQSSILYTLAVNPQNDNELYYSTDRTLFSTFDGGQNWVTKQLGTSRVPTHLLVDPVETAVLYMTVALPL